MRKIITVGILASVSVPAMAADAVFSGFAQGYDVAQPTTTQYLSCGVTTTVGHTTATDTASVSYASHLICEGHSHGTVSGSLTAGLCSYGYVVNVPGDFSRGCTTVSSASGVDNSTDYYARLDALGSYRHNDNNPLAMFYSVQGTFMLSAPGQTFVGGGVLMHGVGGTPEYPAGQVNCSPTPMYGQFSCTYRSAPFNILALSPAAP